MTVCSTVDSVRVTSFMLRSHRTCNLGVAVHRQDICPFIEELHYIGYADTVILIRGHTSLPMLFLLTPGRHFNLITNWSDNYNVQLNELFLTSSILQCTHVIISAVHIHFS